jgi:putative endonuclease
MRNQNQQTGDLGEQYTVDYLKAQRFSILDTNFRTPLGEIDVIAQKGEVVAFVEVKTRQSKRFSLHGLISPSKQQKIIRAAKQYISINFQEKDLLFRFDVALLHYKKETDQYDLEYIPNAFGVKNESTY